MLDSETIFYNNVNKYFDENKKNWKIIKSDYQYSYIDFILINLNNLK